MKIKWYGFFLILLNGCCWFDDVIFSRTINESRRCFVSTCFEKNSGNISVTHLGSFSVPFSRRSSYFELLKTGEVAIKSQLVDLSVKECYNVNPKTRMFYLNDSFLFRT